MTNLVLFVMLVAGGVFLEAKLYRRFMTLLRPTSPTQFHLIKYGYLLSLPTLATFIMMQRLGIVVLYVFAITALLGPIFEWSAGYSYARIMGIPLWKYHHYAISEYTSIFVIPLWGFAGVLILLVAQMFS